MNPETHRREDDPDAERDAPDDDDPQRDSEQGSEPTVPFDPNADDDSALGDTDEHSSA